MSDMKIEEIFGLVDQTMDKLEKHGGKRPQKKRPPPMLPKMQVKRSAVPEELSKVNAGNVVYVPDSELRFLASRLNLETKDLSKLLLRKLMPKLLSYQTAITYTQAALQEGLDVEVDFDAGLAECIKCIGYLDIVHHFLRSSSIPVSMKKKFGEAFAERLALFSIESMVETNKTQQKRIQMQDLQAVVYSHQESKMKRKSISDKNQEPEAKPAAVRRSRREA